VEEAPESEKGQDAGTEKEGDCSSPEDREELSGNHQPMRRRRSTDPKKLLALDEKSEEEVEVKGGNGEPPATSFPQKDLTT